MINQDSRIALDYHQGTKHSDWSLRTNRHYLDRAIQPLPFKIYPDLEPIPLPRITTQSDRAVLSLLPQTEAEGTGKRLDLEDLARILHFSAGITKRKPYPGGEILFRAAACTGALYEIELHVVTGDLDGLQAGVYHYSPRDDALCCLRRGDYRQVLVSAAAEEPGVVQAQLSIISTGIYWRNA
ncbi:MAG: dehydrogenase, partial [Acidobacteriota bacterium]